MKVKITKTSGYTYEVEDVLEVSVQDGYLGMKIYWGYEQVAKDFVEMKNIETFRITDQ